MINDKKYLTAAFLTLSLLFAKAALAQDSGSLTNSDYIEIRQLIEGYPAILDTCTNSGYDYADQYTDDGTFGVSSKWGDDGKIWYKGREDLAVAAGGGKTGCHRNGGGRHHLVTNIVIKASAEGAVARSTLLMITEGDPSTIQWQGGYQDRLVKTAKGWRFVSRRHVWPGYDWPDTAAEMKKRMEKQSEAGSH